MALEAALGGIFVLLARLGDSIDEMIRHSAPIQHMLFHRRLAGISSRVPVFALNEVRDRVSPERGLANEGASMTNDPELHPLMSLRFCTALWLGSIARYELIEKPRLPVAFHFPAVA
jgi:hypothetical protein